MLSKSKINKLAANFLLKNNFPIVVDSGQVIFPGEDDDQNTNSFLLANNIALVTFMSKYYDDLHDDYPCEPGVYIVYVDLNDGEVHMPRHMA